MDTVKIPELSHIKCCLMSRTILKIHKDYLQNNLFKVDIRLSNCPQVNAALYSNRQSAL